MNDYSPLFRALAAVGIIGALWYLTPILDLLEIFAVVCVIPLVFLGAVGVLSGAAFDTLVQLPAAISTAKDKINAHAADIRQKQAMAS